MTRSLNVLIVVALFAAVPRSAEAEGKGEPAVVKVEGALGPNDPKDTKLNTPCNVHVVPLKAGETYILHLASSEFDAYLRLLDEAGKQLAADDDKGVGPKSWDAQITFNCLKDGKYPIVCAYSPSAKTGEKSGKYLLTVKVVVISPLHKAIAKRDWSATEQAFRDLGPEKAANALDVLIHETKKKAMQNFDDFDRDRPFGKPQTKPSRDRPFGKPQIKTSPDTDAMRAVESFTHVDWLQLVQAYPFTLDSEFVLGLAQQCRTKAPLRVVIDDALRYLQKPTRHFGLSDANLAKKLRSVLLLERIDARTAWRYLPPIQLIKEWRADDKQFLGISKSDVTGMFLRKWDSGSDALFLAPLGDILELLSGDLHGEDVSLGTRLALRLLNSYRTSSATSWLIATKISTNVAKSIQMKSASTTQQDLASAHEWLVAFVDKTALKTKPLNESTHPKLKDARKHSRDGFAAASIVHLLGKAMFEQAREPQDKRRIAEHSAENWLTFCGSLFPNYKKLNDWPFPEDDYYREDREKKQDLKILLPVARRESFPVGRLLSMGPTVEMTASLSSSLRNEVRVMEAKILSREARYGEVVRLCGEVVKENPLDAELIVRDALATWSIPPTDAGRTPEARNRIGDMTVADFGRFVASLRQIPDLPLDEADVMASFAKFGVSHRPLRRSDMESVLPEMAKRSETVLRLFVGQLLSLLKKERDALTKAKDVQEKAALGDSKKTEADKATKAAATEAEEVSSEFKALDAVVADWRKSLPEKSPSEWVGALLQAKVRFHWAQHQLHYVEKVVPGANTDVAGYSEHLKECLRLLSTAGELCPHSEKAANGEYPSLELFEVWFANLYLAASERATKDTQAEEIRTKIQAWLKRLPQDENRAIRTAFVHRLLRQLLIPEEGSDRSSVEDQQVYYFVTEAVALLGDLREAREFRDLQAGYLKLKQEIHFSVVPDGSLYRDGLWMGGQRRTYPVGKGEFGVWLTVQHTPKARELSGGFRRYAQNQIENPGTALDARAVANYANDMKKRLTQYLEGTFVIVHVEPLPRPEPLLKRPGAKDGWQETPLFYLILKPKTSVPVTRIPALPLDLNFSDANGMVVLPFTSESVDLQPGDLDPGARQGLQVKQRLLLHPNKVTDGVVTLEITATGKLVPPAPEDLFPDFCSPGFEKENANSREEFKVAFQRGQPFVEVTRHNSVQFRWHDTWSETEFRFPTGAPSTAVKVQRLVWSPDSALGESEGQAVPGETFRVQKLPSGPIPWQPVAWVAAGALGLAVLVWRLRKIPWRNRKTPLPPAFQMPAAVTTLGTIRLLRQLAGNKKLRLSLEERTRMEQDILKLEGEVLAHQGNGQSAAKAILEDWINASNRAMSASLPATA